MIFRRRLIIICTPVHYGTPLSLPPSTQGMLPKLGGYICHGSKVGLAGSACGKRRQPHSLLQMTMHPYHIYNCMLQCAVYNVAYRVRPISIA